jgi:hypothetical protein
VNCAPWIEGRRLTTKASALPLHTDEFLLSKLDAERGSKMLRNAILRAKGYQVPTDFIPPPPPKVEVIVLPTFKTRKGKRGKPKGSRKIRRTFPKIAIIKGVLCSHFGLSEDDLLSGGKQYRFAHPRQIGMYLARKTTSASFPDIALHFGRKDHTTVIHAVREIEKRVALLDLKTLRAIVAVHEVIGS